MRNNRTSRVHPSPDLEHLPTGAAKQCRDLLSFVINGRPAYFACEIEELRDEHPGQPHMQRIISDEPGDDIFIGWWHTPAPQPDPPIPAPQPEPEPQVPVRPPTPRPPTLPTQTPSELRPRGNIIFTRMPEEDDDS